MKLLPVRLLKPGEVLSTAIRMYDGRVLLPAKATLSESYIKRLVNLGIFSVYVEDDIFSDIVITPSLDNDTKVFALKTLSTLFKAIDKDGAIDEDNVKKVGKMIYENVKKTISSTVNLFNFYVVNDERSLHAINVATITAAIAMNMDLNFNVVEEYVLGAILHDIKLHSQKEKETFDHAEDGYNFLKQNRSFSARTYMSVYMHHENFDGTGGPTKLSGDKINIGARIIAIADMYDKLINGYGVDIYSTYHAIEYMNSLAGKQLDPDILKNFNSVVAVYPTGSTVLLNNGYRAIVTRQNANMPTRPVVRLCMKNREDCLEFNLLNERTMFIDKVES